MCRELVGHRGNGARRHDHVAARDVQLMRERERDRTSACGERKIAVEADDPGAASLLPGLGDRDLIAGFDPAAREEAGTDFEQAHARRALP